MSTERRRRYDGERGFTLVELMIVVAIIAILAGILIPNFQNARAQAQTSACESNIRAIATAAELYYTDNQAYPASGSANPVTFASNAANGNNTGTKYLNNTPHDPAAPSGGNATAYTFTSQANTDGTPGYEITCPGEHPNATLVKLSQAANNGAAALGQGTSHIAYSGGVGFGVGTAPTH